ncbi:MAG: hypothetical protein [Bacteriophage sp.]|nr:MAG: hypothetical protein [Bacteriophage sp.]
MYRNKRIIHLVTINNNLGIGYNNDLLYNFEELKEIYSELTIGQVLISGKNSVLNKLITNERRIIHLLDSTNNDMEYNDYNSFEERLELNLDFAVFNSNLLNTDEIIIIGGNSLFEQTKDIVDKLILIEVNDCKKADLFYNIPDNFKIKNAGYWLISSNTGLTYRITEWIN